MKAWAGVLRDTPNGRGGRLSDSSIRHHLNALSSCYTWAHGEDERITNPVVAWKGKPSGTVGETEWLEVPEASLLLEA